MRRLIGWLTEHCAVCAILLDRLFGGRGGAG